ncbi:MAG: hypothetical protein WCW14_03130 [Candidatus Paceibacterota bacterium]|jgi:hypothetical protein
MDGEPTVDNSAPVQAPKGNKVWMWVVIVVIIILVIWWVAR